MNDMDLDRMENELRRLTPADPPPDLMARLERQPGPWTTGASGPRAALLPWRQWLKWLAPVTVATVVGMLLWIGPAEEPVPQEAQAGASPAPWVPQEIELDRRLTAAYEGVARLPDGMPFRFRCYRWDEELVARDASGLVEVRNRGPRMEIVPVSLEVY